MRYIDAKGRILFVHDGLDGKFYGTFYRKSNGSLKRVISHTLPMQRSREDAQRDLDWFAKLKKMKLA